MLALPERTSGLDGGILCGDQMVFEEHATKRRKSVANGVESGARG
jgi:hypothetical protein